MRADVARLFDGMAGSYEELEPWYEHLYAVLHDLVRAALPPVTSRACRALDAGCGTGFQTALLDERGYAAHGVDISAGVLAVAARVVPQARFARATIEALPYADHSFEAVVCCGSTLGFVDEPGTAVREFGRVLRPGGVLILECEHKWSVDLVWAAVSSVTRDSLGYGVAPREVWRQIARPAREGFTIDYCGVPLRLFTMSEIDAMLAAARLTRIRTWGIHSITNLIPSTVLHRRRLGRAGRALYRRLARIDRALAGTPARRLANSVVIVARETGAEATPAGAHAESRQFVVLGCPARS